jgi:hypothetical protein
MEKRKGEDKEKGEKERIWRKEIKRARKRKKETIKGG